MNLWGFLVPKAPRGAPTHTHCPPPLCFCTGRVFWEAGEGKPAAGLPGIKSLLLTIAQDYFEARWSPQLSWICSSKGGPGGISPWDKNTWEKHPQDQGWGGMKKNPNILTPILGFTRAGTCYPAQFGTKPRQGLSNWETTFPEGMRSFNFCSTASMQAQDLEGIRKICHFITALGTKTENQRKTKQSTPWDP